MCLKALSALQRELEREVEVSGVARRIYKSGNGVVVGIPGYVLARAGGEVGDTIEWTNAEGGVLVGQVVKAEEMRRQNRLAFGSLKDGGDNLGG
jgi:antitoxin component of MazEF toxin-antitoxin module